MADVLNRALTIAAVGVLSATALTLATNGLIQPIPPIPPPQKFTLDGGGAASRMLPGNRITLEYPRRFEHVTPLSLELLLRAEFGHVHTVPKTFSSYATLGAHLFGTATSRAAGLQSAYPVIDITVLSNFEAEERNPDRIAVTTDVLVEHAVYTRLSHAGTLVHAPANNLFVSGGAEAGVHHAQPIVRSYAYEAEEFIPHVYATIDFARAELPPPPELAVLIPARDFIFTGTSQPAAASATATLHHVPAIAHRFESVLTGAFYGTATYTSSTPLAKVWRIEATQAVGFSGGATAALAHSIDAQPDEQDADVLLLFAKMLRDIDA